MSREKILESFVPVIDALCKKKWDPLEMAVLSSAGIGPELLFVLREALKALNPTPKRAEVYCLRCGRKKEWCKIILDGQEMEYPICPCELEAEGGRC